MTVSRKSSCQRECAPKHSSQLKKMKMAKPDKSRQRQKLSAAQRTAIGLLLQGKNDRQVAEQVGVSRQTVWDWRMRNPTFATELNRRRQEIWGTQTERLRNLVEKAVDVLETAVDTEQSLSAAVHVLKAVGVYGADLRPVGLIDAVDFDLQLDREDHERLYRAEDEEIARAEARQNRQLRRMLTSM